MEYKRNLKLLRDRMKQEKIDAYIIPMSDPHLSEYVADHWRAIRWISEFSGSTGTIVITIDFAGLWTDSRYFIQAGEQLKGSGFELVKLKIPHTPEFIVWITENLPAKSTIALDGKVFPVNLIKLMEKAFVDKKMGIGVSYTPWLRALVPDINLAYLSGYYKLDQYETIGASLRYFSMGEIVLTGADEVNIGTTKPSEFAFDLSYSRKLSDNLSGGVTLRYIHSNLFGGFGLENYTAGNAVASDVSFFYLNNWGDSRLAKSIAVGINFSNIGSKISYDHGSSKYFLPANLKIGTTYTTDLNDNSSISMSLDFNKLLVPTPTYSYTTTDDVIVLPGKDSNDQSVTSAIFGSFSDAPGGFKEELSEVTVSVGAEYWYKKYFALRTGYFNESQD